MRILVADDHNLVRRCIARILSSHPQLRLCGQATDGAEVIRMALDLLPDLIILDLNMPNVNGLDVSRIVRQKLPQTRILLVSQNDPALLQPAALAAGADSCIDKSRLVVDLIPAIKRIAAASVALTPDQVRPTKSRKPRL